jgi:glycosyltransferase involved in cell wall biosynthesis
LRKSLGLGADTFVAMYSGNMGLAHSFDEFLEAARRLRERSDIRFLFVGCGPRSAEVRDVMEREGLSNIRMLDYVERGDLHLSLSAADVHLISMRPEMTGIVVPGKLYGIMAAARPALFVGPSHCESADTIRRAGCGFTVAPGDADGVVSALTTLAADANLARQMGQKGRLAFLAEHERNLCCYRWLEVVGSLVSRPKAAPSPAATPRLGTAMAPAGTLGDGPVVRVPWGPLQDAAHG